MNRRYRERRTRRHTTQRRPRSFLMRPAGQILILVIVALIVYILLSSGAR